MRGPKAAPLILAVLLAVGAAAQDPAVEKPMSEPEFIQLVNAKAPVDDIIAAVRGRGISFRLSAELEGGLRKLKHESLIAVLKEPARVELHTNALGGKVAVDGEEQGALSAQGQASLTGLAPGDHVLRVRGEGYVDETLTVFVKPGETRRLEVTLRPAVTSTPGPLGSRVSVQAGTAADAALTELEFIKDTPTRAAKLQQMVERFGDNPVLLLAYASSQEAYLEAGQYNQAIAAGEEILRRDPQNFSARVRQAHAYAGTGELEKGLEVAAQARALMDAVAAAPAPDGMGADAWESEKQGLLERAKAQWGNLSYAVFVAATQVTDPARKAALLELFVRIFPESIYRQAAHLQLALAAQQLGDADRMVGAADRGLALNPNDGVLMALLADVLSERGQNLGRARELATRLLDLLKNDSAKVRPEGLGDEQWAPLAQLWEGTAHSILGQVLMHEETAQAVAGMGKTRQAIEEFKAAAPLLKGETQSYARNMFRLGFAYAKIGQLPQARDALTEVMGLETPYRQVAGPVLEQVKRKLGPR